MKKQIKSHQSPDRKAAFMQTMTQARSHMNILQRTFSYLIHIRYFDSIIAVIGIVLLRPILLIGGFIGMIGSLVLFYGTAKYFGYTLSGFEGIVGFMIGWTIGAIVEFTQLLWRSKK